MVLKNYLTITVVLIGLVLFFFYQYKVDLKEVYNKVVVSLTNTGFSPQNVSVKKGEIVSFVNLLERSFWPASDLHPTHELYPEFDSRQPIAKNNEWSFQFKKAGIWKFHDHLAPYFTGTITVLVE